MKTKTPPPPPAPSPLGRAFMWFVVLTCAFALGLLMWLARDILQQLSSAEQSGASGTRLLTGLFVVMAFAGFVAAALWAALKKALNR